MISQNPRIKSVLIFVIKHFPQSDWSMYVVVFWFAQQAFFSLVSIFKTTMRTVLKYLHMSIVYISMFDIWLVDDEMNFLDRVKVLLVGFTDDSHN